MRSQMMILRSLCIAFMFYVLMSRNEAFGYVLPWGKVLIFSAVFFVIMYVEEHVGGQIWRNPNRQRGSESLTEQPITATAAAHADDINRAAKAATASDRGKVLPFMAFVLLLAAMVTLFDGIPVLRCNCRAAQAVVSEGSSRDLSPPLPGTR